MPTYTIIEKCSYAIEAESIEEAKAKWLDWQTDRNDFLTGVEEREISCAEPPYEEGEGGF